MGVDIITIDGPASSGKGTVAKIVASKLGYNYLESGAIYRALALWVVQNQIDETNQMAVCALIDSLRLDFEGDKIILDNIDVTKSLRDEKVGMIASKIAKYGDVRAKLLDFQRSFAKNPGLVTDGRDMGSTVFPQAKLKIFLSADIQVRAERRYKQLQESGKSVIIGAILDDIQFRDMQDSNRDFAPLKLDSSFVFIDNSFLTIEQTVDKIIELLK